MRALILVGGQGQRIKSLSGGLPKCLIPVQDRPFIEHQIELLRSEGIEQFVLCVGYGAHVVKETLEDGSRLGVSVWYSSEDKPLGTAGAIKNASQFVDGEFLCANGDTLVEFSLKRLEASHRNVGAIVTILSTKLEDASGKGTLRTGPAGEILGFEEKASADNPALVNCGFYLMEKEILEYIPSGREVSLEEEIFPRLVSSGLRLSTFPVHGAFVDIGTPEEYLRIREKGWKE